MPRTKKTGKPQHKAKESCNSDEMPPGFIKVPLPKPSKSIEELEKTKGIFNPDEFCKLAREYTLTAVQLCNNNKFERAKPHATVAINIYLKLNSDNYPFHPDELGYTRLLMNMVNPELWKKTMNKVYSKK
jgi:hypothetical protein